MTVPVHETSGFRLTSMIGGLDSAAAIAAFSCGVVSLPILGELGVLQSKQAACQGKNTKQ